MKKVNYIFFFVCLYGMACTQRFQPTTNMSESWVMFGFEKVDSLNPILAPNADLVFICPMSKKEVHWQERNVLNPSAVVKDGQVHLFFRAQDQKGTSRIGLAISNDGLHFRRASMPVFFPDNDKMRTYEWNINKVKNIPPPPDCYFCYFDGTEDPRIVATDDGRYVMTYTSYDGKTARLSLATSTDLVHWTKHGLVLGSEKYRDLWSKSGAIVVQQDGDRMIAVRINGKYWMYFGDTQLFMATSTDLVHWDVAENEESKKMIAVLHPRMGYFDSRLVEPGPYALLRKEGIVLIYNGSNAANFNDQSLPKFTYSAGQALFSRDQPYKLLDRTQSHFIHPDKPYERTGEVNEVCFVEGLVHFKGKWFLYYGTADSKIGVVVRSGL